MRISWYAQARLFRHFAHKHNFWNRSIFLKKHQILSSRLKESFSGNSVKISDCGAFTPFKTLPGCRAFRHSEIFSELFAVCFPYSTQHSIKSVRLHFEVKKHFLTFKPAVLEAGLFAKQFPIRFTGFTGKLHIVCDFGDRLYGKIKTSISVTVWGILGGY